MLHRLTTFIVAVLFVLLMFSSFDSNNADAEMASYYGHELAGSLTASGNPFEPYDYTAAHLDYPFGTVLLVTYDCRSVSVVVNDRGPYVSGRDLDLSLGAAEAIGLNESGIDQVQVEVLYIPE